MLEKNRTFSFWLDNPRIKKLDNANTSCIIDSDKLLKTIFNMKETL